MNRIQILPAAAVVAALTLSGCDASGDGASGTYNPQDPMEVEWAPELGVDPGAMDESPTGLRVRTLEEGEGAPAEPGDSLLLHYTGWLADGTEFDSSRGGDPFAIRLGSTPLIQGWTEGVEGMQPGERRMLVIPPELAYGERGAGDVIPPGAVLVFDVELVENVDRGEGEASGPDAGEGGGPGGGPDGGSGSG